MEISLRGFQSCLQVFVLFLFCDEIFLVVSGYMIFLLFLSLLVRLCITLFFVAIIFIPVVLVVKIVFCIFVVITLFTFKSIIYNILKISVS